MSLSSICPPCKDKSKGHIHMHRVGLAEMNGGGGQQKKKSKIKSCICFVSLTDFCRNITESNLDA